MKILHSTYYLNHMGGQETLLIDIVNRQCKEHQVYLSIMSNLVDQKLLRTIDPRVSIIILNKNNSGKRHFLQAFFKIGRMLKEICPDVIHCHDYFLIKFYILWKKKTCFTVHLVNKPTSYLFLYQKILAISHYVKQYLKTHAKVDSTVIWNGININEYACRTDYKFDPLTDEFKIIQISRFSPIKGQEVAVKAMHTLLQKYPELPVKLYFVGDGESRTKIQSLVDRYGLSNHIVFLGAVDRFWIKTYLQEFHLLIQPSIMEAFGLSVIEGFACGLPVVMSRTGGLPEINKVLNAGALFEVNNDTELADNIYTVYKNYIDKQIEHSPWIVRDRQKLMLFDMEQTVNQYIEAYKTI